jgi:3-oxoacyl-[acyl-carrier protein] reductase
MSNGVVLSVHGCVALITGGSRGIGAAAVRLFVAAGGKVVFSYRTARSEAEKLATELGNENCHPIQADLVSAESAAALVEAATAHFGTLNILVANHGIWPPEDLPIDKMGDDHWRNSLAINLESVFGLVKSVVGQIKRQKSSGHIVLVSSTAGQRGEAFHCDYAASKGALISMVKGLSTELARDGIRVNCVAPGWVQTDMSAATLANPETRERTLRTIPLGRVGTPEEIAAPILFLCTEHAGFITGEIFNVNGGAVLVG